jgi:hypothetical protein
MHKSSANFRLAFYFANIKVWSEFIYRNISCSSTVPSKVVVVVVVVVDDDDDDGDVLFLILVLVLGLCYFCFSALLAIMCNIIILRLTNFMQFTTLRSYSYSGERNINWHGVLCTLVK